MVRLPRFLLIVSVLGSAPIASASGAGRPADPLLRLVPDDAGLTLAVEDLRDHARDFFASPVSEGLLQLPAVSRWFESNDFRRLDAARRQIERTLKADVATLRDDLVGDALVLAMVVPPGAPPDAARGMLLLRPRDQDLLDRAIVVWNKTDGRKLKAVDVQFWKGVPYHCRRFQPGTKPDEWYAVLDGRILAWSNSEDLVRGAIERHLDDSADVGLYTVPAFRRLRQGLPAGALASLFVEPRTLERAIREDKRPRDEAQERLTRTVLGFLGAVDYAGLALEWRDGPILHLRQELAPERVSDTWRAWGDRQGSAADLVRSVPPSAIALVAGHLHLPPILELLRVLLPANDWSRLELLAEALRAPKLEGGELLTRLGPGTVAYLEAPEANSTSWPWVMASNLSAPGGGADPELARRVEGVMRSAFALQALQALQAKPGQGPGPIKLVDRKVPEGTITTLTASGWPAFAVVPDRAILGSSPDAVGKFLEAGPEAGPAQLSRHRAAYFPGTESFAYVDLDRLRRAMMEHRPEAERWLSKRKVSAKDLEQALDLFALFRFGFATARMGPECRWMHHTIGLIADRPGP
jgi:hypothetical protein